jgi:hypothetical protein
MGGSAQAVEIISVMKPLHYLCKALGLASFYLHKKYEKTRNIFLESGVWWSCLWAVIYAVNLCLEVLDTVRDPEIPVKIAVVSALYYLSLHLTNIIFLCVCSIFKRRQIPQIVHQIEELENMFTIKVDGNIMFYKGMRKFVMFETLLLLFYIVMLIIYVCMYAMYDSSVLKCFMFVLESLGCTFNSLMIIQFMSVIMISRHICKCINHELEMCCDMIENYSRYSIIPRAGGVSISRSLDVKCFRCLRNHVHGLRLVYSRLNKVTRLVNAYYGLPILLGVSWLFMSVVNVLYTTLYFFIYVSYTDNNFIRYANISVSVSFCIYCGIFMAILTATCHIVGSETETTVFHIHKILLHRDLGKQTENELKKFCSQVIQLKLEISACGLFRLNLPFFNNFISKVFAYFIIMFQLK